ncbi:leucyl aminopeptidase family protein [Actinokineospora guangxiensis]|uniref:Probable cytosol aminopeptidase n=1 Tax=Actinokineospora guangxiensis TaxID=1490288 RepID=A0ABW0EMQ2_9PSEU
MSTPVPTVPTPLPSVEVVAASRAGVPSVVIGRPADDGDQPSFGDPALTPEWVGATGLTGKAGEVQACPPGAAARWALGVGAGAAADWRAAGAALARAAQGSLTADDSAAGRGVQVELPEDLGSSAEDSAEESVAAFVRGVLLGGYRFTVTGQERPPRLKGLRLVVSDPDRRERVAAMAGRATVLAEATAFARDLANAPANVKDPAWLARTVAKAAGRTSGVDAVVRDEKWLAQRGFGGVLAVGGGSARPPRLLELRYAPKGATGPHLVLVGKGITFDTGGISVKPADGMHLMRTDMAGGGAVAAATIAIARLGLRVRVTALVPCAENHISGSSYRPGDIVTHYGGQTTEVTNTDAEGRMVLADALAYARRDLDADLLVDVATLTGAMKVTLGLRTGGLFASDDDLAARVAAAGERSGEAWWRMPLLEDSADDVVSTIADLRQCPPGPGGITAALFLREFTGGLPWAHLDIAGPARADKTYGDVVPGATGFAARTLVELAESYAG